MQDFFLGVGNWYADMNFTFAFCFSYKTMIPTDWTLSGQLYGEPISLLQCGTIILSTMVPQPPTSNSIFTHLEIIEALVEEKNSQAQITATEGNPPKWCNPTQLIKIDAADKTNSSKSCNSPNSSYSLANLPCFSFVIYHEWWWYSPEESWLVHLILPGFERIHLLQGLEAGG